MANVNEVEITGWMPFNIYDNEGALRWLGIINTPSYGLSVSYGATKDGPVNEHGGRTTFYRFTIEGREAIWQGTGTRSVGYLVHCLQDGGAEVESAMARDMEMSDNESWEDILEMLDTGRNTWEAGEQYVAGGGVRCPFCKSEDIEGQFVSIESGTAWQKVNCLNCGERWQDTYKLTGYTQEFN